MDVKLRCEPFVAFPASVPRGWEMHVHPHIVEEDGEQFVRSYHGTHCGAAKMVMATSSCAALRGMKRGGRPRGK